MTRVEVSVLIVSWNTLAETRRCLDSVRAVEGVGHEVIVVDNGSLDGSAEMLASRDDILLIRNGENRGFAAAVNQAYTCASGELLLLLNSDVRLEPDTLRSLVHFLRDRPEAAGVAPLYLGPDGMVQQHYMRLPTFAGALALATGLRKLPGFRAAMRRYLMDGEDFSRPRPVEQPSASCLLLRRRVLGPHRVFDERLPVYFNDVWLARRLNDAGHQLWMTPDAVVTHTLGASTRLLSHAARSRHHLGGLVRYLQLTESAPRMKLFRALVFVDRALRRALHLHGHLGLGDLRAALAGDTGPLPDGDPREWVVMLSAVGWPVGCQRQHALARQLAAHYRVLFVEPPGQRPRWRFSVQAVAPSLWRMTPPGVLPFGRQVPAINHLNRRVAGRLIRRWLDERPAARTVWLDEDLAVPAVGRLGEKAVVYDVADLDWTFTRRWNRWHLRSAARTAAGVADLVIASSPALPERLPSARRPPVVVPNGCDPELFTAQGPVADWVNRLAGPRLGYVGVIDTRAFDGELFAAVARRRPDWTFVLAGASTRAGRAALRGLPNVHRCGQLPLEEVPAFLRGCDVCLVPYRVGGLIDYVQPKKLYDYLALEKPVVATPLPALSRLGPDLVRLATDADGFVAAVEQALRAARCPRARAARRAAAVANSWTAQGETVRTLLAGVGRADPR